MRLIRVTVSGIVMALLVILPVSAFKPNDAGHLGISSEALSDTSRVVDSETLKFSERAVKQIRDANKDTDCLSCQAEASFHFDDESFAAATERLTTLKDSIIAKITASSPDGAAARKDLGGALHTLQDFYAHSTWVELGSSGIDTRLGRSTFAGLPLGVATCPADPAILGGAGLTSLTSGWFQRPLCDPPAGKCRHGVPVFCPAGLNKDDASRTGYDSARGKAVTATKDFLNQILDAPGVAGNAKAIKALMDIKSTLGMIIDDTGSMGGVIDSVKVQVAGIVDSVKGTEDEPAQYLLVRFGDPDVGPPFVTGDADAFLARVNGLFASGGGDCPELSQSGLLQAVEASQSDATLFLFTDASAKDAGLAGNVVAAANAKRITITPLLFGSCSPVDPAYVRIAKETGGQLFFLSRSEAGLIFTLVKPQLPGNLVPVLLASGSLNGGSLEFVAPVDSSVESATFSVSIDVKGPIGLLRPSGAAVAPGDPDATITDLSSGRVVTIAAPETGAWRLQVQGTGALSVAALVNSSIQLNSFQFVELTGRPAHEGLFPIPGQPLAGSHQTALASLFGPASTAEFKLVSEAGDTIQPITLMRDNPDAAADEFVGTLDLPAQPFRVAVTGVDAGGLPYSRFFPTLFNARTVEVVSESLVTTLPAGATTTLSFLVRNLGAPATFQVVAADSRGFARGANPSTLALGTGEAGTVSVDVFVPVGTPEGTDVSITVVATSLADATVTNSATVSLTVVTNRPPIADAGPDQTLECSGHDRTPATLDGSRSGDPDGNALTFEWRDQDNNMVGTTAIVAVTVGLGTHTFSLTVTDPGGLSSTAINQVTVQDGTPPVISSLTAHPGSLRSRGERDDLVPVVLRVSVADVCDPNPSCKITSVVRHRDEHDRDDDDMGRGREADGSHHDDDHRDWVITGDLTLKLRAKHGNEYRITVQCTDGSGNTSTRAVTVKVKGGDHD